MAILNQFKVPIKPGLLPALLFTAAWQAPQGEICAECWLLLPEAPNQSITSIHHFFGVPAGMDLSTAMEATLAKMDQEIELAKMAAGSPIGWPSPARTPIEMEALIGLIAVGSFPGLGEVQNSTCDEQRKFVSSLPSFGKKVSDLTMA